MSRFDKNPFDEEGETNPYSGASAPAPAASTGSFFSRITPKLALGGGGTSFSASSADNMPATAEELQRKEKELEALEASLKKKEEELARKEASAGVEVKNFPPFFPIIHHDIANDIPDDVKFLIRPVFWSWLGIMLCLVYNFIGTTSAWIGGAFYFTDGAGNFFLSLIYIIAGVPLSYIMWYRRLYLALRRDSTIGYTVFFIGYGIHILFCLFASIAPPFIFQGYSFTGVIVTIDIFSHGFTAVGIIYSIGATLFISETALSIYNMGRVLAHFRGESKRMPTTS